MNKQKVLFVDVDQTLYDNINGIIYPSTIEVLKKLSKREDVDIFLATGRSISTIDHLKPIIPYFKGFVTNNGQTVVVNSKIIFERPISPKIVKKLEDYANTEKIPMAYVGDYNAYVNFISHQSSLALLKFHIYSVQNLNNEPYKASMPIKQFWFFGNQDQIKKAQENIPELDFVNWPGDFGCDAIMKGFSKKDGIEAVIEYYKYDQNNTYAIGDGDNDVGMFKCVEHSIAMGNGTEKAKANAKYLADDITKDGFAKALTKMFALDQG